MPYTRAWNEATPVGSDLANQLDTIIQNTKTDFRERVAGIFGLTALEFAADPIVPKTLTLSGALVAASFTGNVTGTILTAAQPNITSVGTLTSLTVAGSIIANGGTLNFSAFVGQTSIVGSTTGLAIKNYTGSANNLSFTDAGAATFRSTVDGITTLTAVTVVANLTGTILTAAQANITSLGTLTGLALGGNISPSLDATHSIGDNTHRLLDVFTARIKGMPPLGIGDQSGAILILTKTGTGSPISAVAQNKFIEITGNDGVSYKVPAWI